jgi:hypothetical protein
MDYLIAWFGLWGNEQKASLERVKRNIRIVLILLTMAFIEAVINLILILLLITLIFSRGLDNFINNINILYDNRLGDAIGAKRSRYSRFNVA